MARRDLMAFTVYRLKKWLLRLGKQGLPAKPRRYQTDNAGSQFDGNQAGGNEPFASGLTKESVRMFKAKEWMGPPQAGLDGGKHSDAMPEDIDLRATAEAGRLIKKLAATISRRRKHGCKRKTVDVRKTIHRNMLHGGTLLKMSWRMRKPGKPRVILILDTSSSMVRHARMMLQFLYALQHELRSVEVFIFGNHLNYVTPYLQPDFKALLKEVSRLPQWNFGGTELWRPLAQLRDNYSHLLTARTVVILLTDCQFYEKFFALAPLNNLRRKVKRLYLFNPDPRTKDLDNKYYQETIRHFKTVVDRMFYTETIHEVAATLRQIML
ncbi:MAG: VWA domain-containing protein [Syntrophomonadaceae bacterium]|nr:VWA domain-containing protein [Syntrophomonadaceae bacterium]